MGAEKSEQLSFGSELYRIRVKLGLSQSQVADEAGIARGYYSQLENSRRNAPPLQTVLRIAQALNVDEADLIQLCANASIERQSLGMKPIDDTKFRMPRVYVVSNGRAIAVSTEKQRKIMRILKEP